MIKIEFTFDSLEEASLFLSQNKIGTERYYDLEDIFQELRSSIKHEAHSEEAHQELLKIRTSLEKLL